MKATGVPLLCAHVDEVKQLPISDSVDVKRYLARAAPHALPRDLPRSVLILTREWDPEADLVGLELFARGINYIRLNVEDIPDNFRYSCDISGSLARVRFSVCDEEVAASDVRVVLFRHFRPSLLSSRSPETTFADTFSNEQWHAAFRILKEALQCVWINDYDAIQAAYNRARQLEAARECGFSIPRTLITNDPVAASRFHDDHKEPLIIKALHHHSVEYDTKRYSMYARDIETSRTDALQGLVAAPCVIQQKIQKVGEVRVTIFGDKVYAVKLLPSSPALAQEDIHKGPLADVHKRPIVCAPSFEQRCHALVSMFKLRYAALDFLLASDGTEYFLEMNPDGDWCWLEPQTGLPLTSTMADYISRLVTASG
jgi:glutathione synthase/RimK-type ligase-like ATP-grasp enzyme